MNAKQPTLAIGLPYFLSDETDKEYSHLHTMMTIPSIAGEMVDYILQLAKHGLFFFIIDDETVKRIISPLYNKLIGFTSLSAEEVAKKHKDKFLGQAVHYPQLPCAIIEYYRELPSKETYTKYYPMDHICVLGDCYRYTEVEIKWNYEKYGHIWGPQMFRSMQRNLANKSPNTQMIIQATWEWPLHLTNYALKQMKLPAIKKVKQVEPFRYDPTGPSSTEMFHYDPTCGSATGYVFRPIAPVKPTPEPISPQHVYNFITTDIQEARAKAVRQFKCARNQKRKERHIKHIMNRTQKVLQINSQEGESTSKSPTTTATSPATTEKTEMMETSSSTSPSDTGAAGSSNKG